VHFKIDLAANSVCTPQEGQNRSNFVKFDGDRLDLNSGMETRHSSLIAKGAYPRGRSIGTARNIALNSAFSTSRDKETLDSAGGRRQNLGTIVNYKKAEGINDHTGVNSFRKWTGHPATVRTGKLNWPREGMEVHQRMISGHRKIAKLEPIE
jgi:hypothetical protein